MHVVYPVCCGLDVHQAQRTACLRCVSPEGQMTLERREFGTPYGELRALSAWLAAHACPVVALESTGVSWRPGYPGRVGTGEVRVGNARDIRPRPGKKTDTADAAWIAALLAHGLSRPSVVPPPAMSALRDVTRTRVALVQTRTQAKTRVHKVREDTHSKLSSVVTDLCGTSGRQMLAALSAGERDPKRLSVLALGR
jgi:transposase